MGGKVAADLHQDFIIPKPTWTLDGKAVMKDGKLLG
jgi:leucyl aminopeptidase (aminopeptidase T)